MFEPIFLYIMQIDTAVLHFQNQKLVQKLEAQKVEYSALDNKFNQLKERQQPYDSTLEVVNRSWEEVMPVFVVSFFLLSMIYVIYIFQTIILS